MKPIKLVFLCTLLIVTNILLGQNKVVSLAYHVPTKQLQNLSIVKLGLRTVFVNDPDFFISLSNSRNGVAKLNLLTAGLYKIEDGFGGHIVYLEGGDSISLTLTEVKNLSRLLATGTFLNTFNKLTAKGRYAWHYLFFDEYDRRTNNIYPSKKYDLAKNVMAFKSKCDNAHKIGLILLDSLAAENCISKQFKLVAEQELNAMYVARMCSPLSLVPKDKVDPSYFTKLNELYFNDSAYAVMCNSYLQAGSLYTYYIHNVLNIKEPYTNLLNHLSSINVNYSGIIKDKLLSWQIETHIDKKYHLFDSCYKIYLNSCKNEKLKKEVAKKVASYSIPPNSLLDKSITSILFSSKIQQQSDDSTTLLSLFKDSIPILIDCWATWCIPCRNQLPFLHEFEKKYREKVKVVYLSFDKEDVKWKAFLHKNNLKNNQFIIDNNFDSDFSKYFGITEIPRYILVGKGGARVLDAKMPLPALRDEFEAALLKYL